MNLAIPFRLFGRRLTATVPQRFDAGDDRAASNAEEALTARRAWLEEAEHTLAEFSS